MTKIKDMTKQAFCSLCQEETAHALSIEGATNDITLTCPCGHFIKVQHGTDKAGLDEFLAEHQALNTRDLSIQIPILTDEEKDAELGALV
jgi:hypothetical protein